MSIYPNLHMHPTSYGSPVVAGEMNQIHIGKYCSISDTVLFDGGMQHNSRFVTTFPLWKIGSAERKDRMCKGDIHVGNDVWIGHEAVIMSGVTIHDGAVIGARAVVTKDVDPYTIVGGVPAKLIRHRFPLPLIGILLQIKWWDWPQEKILANSHLLLSENFEGFLAAVGLTTEKLGEISA